MTSNHPNHPTLDLEVDTTLEEPDMNKVKDERFQRNRDVMKTVYSHVTNTVFPKAVNLNERDVAATRIQACYRGYLGRKQYVTALYEQFEREEALQRQKILEQVEEGELLVENHRLEVEMDDNMTTRRNKSRQLQSNAITIQRAWRNFHEKKANEIQQRSQHQQPMSVSNSNDSLNKVAQIESENEEHHSNAPQINIQNDKEKSGDRKKDESELSPVSSNKSGSGTAVLNNRNLMIDTDPESIVSDYSEMAETIKEHLANVQIIQKEDLDSGNTMQNEFLVQQKIPQLRDETDAEYAKRLRKLNFLSLAQEFAELKKVDASALPFGAHKTQQMLISPLSESSSSAMSDSLGVDSAITTPIESSDDKIRFPGECNNINAQLPDNAKISGNANDGQHYENIQIRKTQAWDEKSDLTDYTPSDSDYKILSTGGDMSDGESIDRGVDSLMEDLESAPMNTQHGAADTKVVPAVVLTSSDNSINAQSNSAKPTTPKQAFTENNESSPKHTSSLNTKTNKSQASTSQSSKMGSNPQPHGSQLEEPDSESHVVSKSNRDRSKSPTVRYLSGSAKSRSPSGSPRRTSANQKAAVSTTGEGLEDFDVYNIESTMPHMDWAKIEEELQRAADEQKMKKVF